MSRPREFASQQEREAYRIGQLDGAEDAIELVAELVHECERNGIVDIARLVRGMRPSLEKAS